MTTGSHVAAYAEAQKLDIYWDPAMAEVLETWGAKNTWHEIEFLMANKSGRVLDIACGTARTIRQLQRFASLDLHGCDISDFLIEKGIERGVEKSKLTVCDATQTPYADNSFDYAYSIGSLEHFTDPAIELFIKESKRICNGISYHMVPVSKSGRDEGWVNRFQDYYNNSEDWWYQKFRKYYADVIIMPSLWDDDISDGRWFICRKTHLPERIVRFLKRKILGRV